MIVKLYLQLFLTLVFWKRFESKLVFDFYNDPFDILDHCAEKQVNIWPLPQRISSGGSFREVNSCFNFTSNIKSHTLKTAFKRYKRIIFPHPIRGCSANHDSLSELNVIVNDPSEAHPQLGFNETYTLKVTEGQGAIITAETIYGALRGLETFSQLVLFNFESESYGISQVPWEIEDFPRFSHRGLMIDTSRHFLPIPHIKALIDSMEYAKLNVLHWHIVDEPSFPMQSRTYPKLWNGAFSKQERYLQSDMEDIVEYARLRGIRAMIEFDMPGHADSWCTGYPELCPSMTCRDPLNPASNLTFQLIESLLKECTGGQRRKGLFPDDFIHLGGDEVNTLCWTKSPQIKEWMKAKGLDERGTYKYFVKKAGQIAISQGRFPIQWVEVYENFGKDLDNRTVIHVWKDKATLQRVVNDGYRTLLSDNANLYLDGLATPWHKLYLDDPHENISHDKEHLVLGGQAEMWGETVDGSDLQNTVWPRTAAFAERFWSDRSVNSTACALPRLQDFRCRLLQRGVAAAGVKNPVARAAPPNPGTCRI